MSTERRIGAIQALVAGVLATGLGYIYVGRARQGCLLLLSFLILMIAFTWSRAVLQPWGWYLMAGSLVSLALLILIHPVVIAFRQRFAARKTYNRWWAYIGWFLAVWLGFNVILATRASLLGYEPLRVASASMAPTLQRGDWVMSDTWRYRSKQPVVGELVVFTLESGGARNLKRVAAGPGDTIEIKDGIVILNGEPASEPYVQKSDGNRPFGRNLPPLTISESQVFVLGDSRNRSLDSRAFGPIPMSAIHARVDYIWFSYGDGNVRWERFPRWVLLL